MRIPTTIHDIGLCYFGWVKKIIKAKYTDMRTGEQWQGHILAKGCPVCGRYVVLGAEGVVEDERQRITESHERALNGPRFDDSPVGKAVALAAGIDPLRFKKTAERW